jgi:hypothetical protein
VTAASIRPSSSSVTKDSDAAKEDIPSARSYTKSQTRVVELHRTSSSASASHRAACSIQTHPTASSNRSSSQTRSEGCPRIRSQTLMPKFSRREHHSSCFYNSMTSSSMMSTRRAPVGKRPSMDCAAEDTATPSLQNGKLLDPFLALPLRLLPPPLGVTAT